MTDLPREPAELGIAGDKCRPDDLMVSGAPRPGTIGEASGSRPGLIKHLTRGRARAPTRRYLTQDGLAFSLVWAELAIVEAVVVPLGDRASEQL